VQYPCNNSLPKSKWNQLTKIRLRVTILFLTLKTIKCYESKREHTHSRNSELQTIIIKQCSTKMHDIIKYWQKLFLIKQIIFYRHFSPTSKQITSIVFIDSVGSRSLWLKKLRTKYINKTKIKTHQHQLYSLTMLSRNLLLPDHFQCIY
jgi:hypothetical protein